MRILVCLMAVAAWAQPQQPAQQTPPPPPVRSPEVHSDHSVTFRLRAPNAKEVFLSREGTQRVPMQKDDQGVWSVQTDPLEPDYYGYSFVVDGVMTLDPNNSQFKPNLMNVQNAVHVPGPPTLPWEVNNVPRGEVDHHFYKSAIIGDNRDFYVYTPPGYDPTSRSFIRCSTCCMDIAMTRAVGPRWATQT